MLLASHFKRKRKTYSILLITFFTAIALMFTAFHMNTVNKKTEAFNDKKALLAQQKPAKLSAARIVKPTPTPKLITPTPKKKQSVRPVYLGAWTQGLWSEQTYTLHPEALQALQNKVGKKFAIAHYYRGWENLGRESIVNELNTLSNNGWRPMLSANPYFFPECTQKGENIYKTIAGGSCDAFLQKIGTNFKNYGKPVYLRFAWEMNIEAIEWSVQKTGSSPADYVQAWQRFHTVVSQQGANNVIWVWSPNTITHNSIPYSQLYPGDAYVNWVGLDGYNWGTTQPWTHWQSFNEVFASSYASITSVAPTKPIMIAETNTTDQGGNKPAWYQDAFVTQMSTNFPKVQALVIYNEDRSATEKVNWFIDISPESLQSFSSAVQNSMYLSSF